MTPLETLKEYVESKGIMFTIRFIVERDEWFGILHITKIDSVDSYRADLEDLVADLIKKSDKAIKKGLELK